MAFSQPLPDAPEPILQNPRFFLFALVAAGALTAVTHFLLDPEDVQGFEDEKDPLGRLLNRIYFVMATLSTVGYGDMHPKTRKAKSVALVLFAIVLALGSV